MVSSDVVSLVRTMMFAAILVAGCDAPPQPTTADPSPVGTDHVCPPPVAGQIDFEMAPTILRLLQLRGHGHEVRPPIDDRRIDDALVAMLSFQCEYDVTVADLPIFDALVREHPDLRGDIFCFDAPGSGLRYDPATRHWETRDEASKSIAPARVER